jgi:hypothetical protein
MVMHHSSGDSFVAMVQAANLPDLYDPTDRGSLDSPGDRSIFVQRQMGSGSLVVFEIGLQGSSRPLVEP